MKEFIKVMKALSDPNRVRLLKLLQQRTMCVCEIQAALGIAQPTVSKHLKILEDAGLVGHRKEGLWVNYSLTDGEKSPYAASLLGSLRHWLVDDPCIRKLIEKSKGIRREDLCGTHG
jgi:ArsR family transcriptional regulator